MFNSIILKKVYCPIWVKMLSYVYLTSCESLSQFYILEKRFNDGK